MKLSRDKKHSVLRASVILAHFLVCNQGVEFIVEKEYREKILDKLKEEIPVLHSVLDEETKTCMKNKAECMIYEHFCGENKHWNFQNLILYLKSSFENESPPFLNFFFTRSVFHAGRK